MKWYASLLKPCPLCGGEAEFVDFPDDVYVKCSKCGTRGAPDDYPQTAVDDWNKLPRMKWIPIDEVPEEWKDGRSLMAWVLGGYVPCVHCSGKWKIAIITAVEINPTHLMEIVRPK